MEAFHTLSCIIFTTTLLVSSIVQILQMVKPRLRKVKLLIAQGHTARTDTRVEQRARTEPCPKSKGPG